MQKITRNIWSHKSLETGERYPVVETRKDEPLLVNDYPSLIQALAGISFHNPDLGLFYRGQQNDYTTGIGQSSLVPSIYRGWGPSGVKRRRIMRQRFDRLDQAVDLLKRDFNEQKLPSKNRVFQFEEVAWAILQHYGVTPTPLLDFTHSVRVAASFATQGDGDYGHVFAVGLPYPSASISFYADLQIVNVRLLSICPPEAQRPYFQDACMVGTFPHRYRFGYNSKIDFGRRLIAKFKLPKRSFWSETYPPIPSEALYPSDDRIKDLCTTVQVELNG